MKSQLIVPLTAFLLLSFIPIFDALSFTGFAITDLEENDSDFAYEADLWTTSIAITGLPYTVCSGTYLLGGYKVLGNIGVSAEGQYFERIYTQLPTHQMVYFVFSLWALDAWNGPLGDFFQISFDNRMFNAWNFNEINFPNNNLCGVSSERDLAPVRIFGRAYHSNVALTFRIISQLKQWPGHESFGIRDLNILFVDSPVTNTESFCGLAPIKLDISQCICPEGYFENPVGSGTCTACHSNCKSCFGPDAKSCYECASGIYFTGQTCLKCHEFCATCTGEAINQCTTCKPGMFMINSDPTQCTDKCKSPFTVSYINEKPNCLSSPTCLSPSFLDASGACLSTCAFPLEQNIISILRECIYPCDPGQYLYWNGSCNATCKAPLFQSSGAVTTRRCDPICLASGQFVYWDGSCAATCDAPLVQKFQDSKKFCTYPCTELEYLYPNGTCLSTCPYPLTASEDKGKQFCKSPCTDTQYIAWNAACIDECDFPLRMKTESIARFCLSPCQDSAEYYYEETGLCESQCNALTIIDEKTLFLKCLTTDPRSEERTFLLNLLSSPTGPDSVSLFAVPKVLSYVRYLNINLPIRLERVIQAQGRSPLSLRLPQTLPDSARDSLTLRDIPSIFVKRGIHSSFLVNFWQEFTTWCIALVCIAVFTLLEFLFRWLQWSIVQTICERLRIILGWSFLLILIGTGLGDLFLSAWFEITTVKLDAILAVTSFLMCAIITSLTAIFLFKTFHLIAEIYKAKTAAQSKKDPDEYIKCLLPWQNYQVIYRTLDNNSLPNRIFFFIYMARLLLPMAIASCFYSVPLLQTILYVCINLAIIIYLIKMKPIKRQVNLVQLLVLESISFMINIFFLSLTILDIEESTDDANIILLGDLVILGFDAIGLHLAFFFIAKILLAFRDSFQLRLEQPKIAKDILFNILFLPLQQGGMGFESANVNKPQLSKEDPSKSMKKNFLKWDEPPKKQKIQLDASEITRYFRGAEDEIELFAQVNKQQEDMSALEKVKVLTLGDDPEGNNRRNLEYFHHPIVDRTKIKVPEANHEKSPDLGANDNSLQTNLEPFELEPGSTFRSDRPFLRGLSDTQRMYRSPSFREEPATAISHHYEPEQRRNRLDSEGGVGSFLPRKNLF